MEQKFLRRDPKSKAIINSDQVAYSSFRSDEKKSRELQKTINRVDTLQGDVNEIKQMLKTLINGLNKNG